MLRLLACALAAHAIAPKRPSSAKTKRRARPPPPPPARKGLVPDVIGALDFECTCAAGDWHYAHEIIEFPVVLFDARTGELGESFRSYVRPTENATLSPFCTELTGIEQATVDAAPVLAEVLEQLDAWLRERGLLDDVPFAFATDGWDLEHFLAAECARKGIRKPAYCDRWVDLSKAFAERRAAQDARNGRQKGRSSRRANLMTMLRHYKMPFEGRLHSGLDDARNIARVGLRLLETEEGRLHVNDALPGADLGGEPPELTWVPA